MRRGEKREKCFAVFETVCVSNSLPPLALKKSVGDIRPKLRQSSQWLFSWAVCKLR